MPLSYRGNNGVLGPTQGPQTGEGEGGERGGGGGGPSLYVIALPSTKTPRAPGSLAHRVEPNHGIHPRMAHTHPNERHSRQALLTPVFRTLVSHITRGLCPNAAPNPLRHTPTPLLELSGPRLDCHPTQPAVLGTDDAKTSCARDVPARAPRTPRPGGAACGGHARASS